MKFTCLKENLLGALTFVERGIAKSSHLPALANLFLEVADGKLKLATTDLEIGMVSWCAGKAEADGTITLPVKVFSGLINALDAEKLTLQALNDTCRVESGVFSASIKGFPADEFPIIPQIENEVALVVEAAGFLAGLGHVAGSVAYEGTRPELTGVLLSVEAGKISLVATDSFRLALASIVNVKTDGIAKSFFQDHTLILPGKTVRELTRIINPGEPDLVIAIGENQIQFSQTPWRLVSRLLEGAYPRYEDIIPASALGHRVFLRQKFIGALKRAQLFAGRVERVECEFTEARCRLKSEDPAVGSVNEEVPTEGEGRSERFAFNIRYLMDGVTLFGGERVFCEYNESQAPVVFHSGERDRALYIVMPMK